MLRIAKHASCDVPSAIHWCSCGEELLTLTEYHINKHLTGVQPQVTGHCQCESTNAQCILVIVVWEHIIYSVYVVTLTVFLFALSQRCPERVEIPSCTLQMALIKTFLPQSAHVQMTLTVELLC